MNKVNYDKSHRNTKMKYNALKIFISILLQLVFIAIILILLLLEIRDVSIMVILSGIVVTIILDIVIMLILFNSRKIAPIETIEEEVIENYDYENTHRVFDGIADIEDLLDTVNEETEFFDDEKMLQESMATIEINTGSRNGVEVINSESFIVGRQCELQGWIENAEVSRKHFEIFKLEKDYYIRDLGSMSGTKVNGVKLDIDEERKLSDRDVIEIPSLVITFRL